MATFFGEIVETSSRAFLDDEEDEFDENSTDTIISKCEFAVSWTADKPKVTGQPLVFIYGVIVEAFAKQHILNSAKPVGVIEINHEGKKKKVVGQIYQLPSNILACIVSEIPNVEAIPFVDGLSFLLSESSQVLILTSLPVSQFRCPFSFIKSEGFLRTLATNPPPEALQVSCPKLEIPNIASGVPAAVLMWCQKEFRKARLVICFAEESCGIIDSRTMTPLMALRSCELLNKIFAISDTTPKPPITHDVAGNMYL